METIEEISAIKQIEHFMLPRMEDPEHEIIHACVYLQFHKVKKKKKKRSVLIEYSAVQYSFDKKLSLQRWQRF